LSIGFDRDGQSHRHGASHGHGESHHHHGEHDHHHDGAHHDESGCDLAPIPAVPLDVAAVRARLAAEKGPAYWRSLDELAQSEAFVDLLHREFPRQAAIWDDNLSRRRFLSLAGASLALAGLTYPIVVM
jgi:MoCo/4Fe-4S cofactor protein with predicted Tat translocation signal